MGGSKKQQQQKRAVPSTDTTPASALLAAVTPDDEDKGRASKRLRADECQLHCECCERSPEEADPKQCCACLLRAPPPFSASP